MKWIFSIVMLFSMSNLLLSQQSYSNNNIQLRNSNTLKYINYKSYSLSKMAIKYDYLHYYFHMTKSANVYNNTFVPISMSNRNIDLKYYQSAMPKSIAVYDFTFNSYRYFTFSSKLNFDINSALIHNKPYSTYTNIDSFNPYGANNFKDAIWLGLFNSLLKIGR